MSCDTTHVRPGHRRVRPLVRPGPDHRPAARHRPPAHPERGVPVAVVPAADGQDGGGEAGGVLAGGAVLPVGVVLLEKCTKVNDKISFSVWETEKIGK